MGLLINLFGQKGVIVFEGTTIDGREFNGETEIGLFNCNEDAVKNRLRNMMYVKEGVTVDTIAITEFREYK